MKIEYEFFVAGTPVPQGSKSAAIGRDGRVHVYEKLGKRLKVWRDVVTIVAKSERKGAPPLQGALGVSLMFHVKHPVKGARREHPMGVPDLDKLVRGVLDALTHARIWVDDSQVCELHATKLYAARPKGETGVWIGVSQLHTEGSDHA